MTKTLSKLTAVSFLNHTVYDGNQHKGSKPDQAKAQKAEGQHLVIGTRRGVIGIVKDEKLRTERDIDRGQKSQDISCLLYTSRCV